MGFVDDSDSSDVENVSGASTPDIEEAAMNGDKGFLFNQNQGRRRSYTTDPRTPITRNNDLLAVTRLRRKGITESEEIWEELEDDTVDERSPSGGRRHSTMSTPATKTGQARIDDIPNEASPLLGRSNTGRNYRNQRRRRSAQVAEGRGNGAESQEALGGWWKLDWWRGRKIKGEGDVGGARVDEHRNREHE